MGDYHFSRSPRGYLPSDAPADQKGQDCRISAGEPGAQGFESRERMGDRLLRIPYVGRCTLRYYNPDGRNLRRCHVKNPDRNELEVEWGTGQALAKYIVTVPAARSLEELMAAGRICSGGSDRGFPFSSVKDLLFGGEGGCPHDRLGAGPLGGPGGDGGVPVAAGVDEEASEGSPSGASSCPERGFTPRMWGRLRARAKKTGIRMPPDA
jgi:hypothetical protein